jgi:hypothetical protein
VGPETHNQVNADRQRLAVRLLREAGESGLTRETLAKDLNCSTRQVDRTMVELASAGADLDRQRFTRDGVSLVRIILSQGPTWDEAVTPRAMVALRIAMMALEQVGTEVWADHLKSFEEVTGPHLSTRDRIMFESLVMPCLRFSRVMPSGPTSRRRCKASWRRLESTRPPVLSVEVAPELMGPPDGLPSEVEGLEQPSLASNVSLL